MRYMAYVSEGFRDKCAVIGVSGHGEAAKYCYLGLYALQHRGQEGAGIVASHGGRFSVHRGTGLVADVFDEARLSKLLGSFAVGHTRYATFGGKDWQNLQPLVASSSRESVAVAHNGNLVNARELRLQLEDNGAIFSTTSDTEVILHLLAHVDRNKSFSERLALALRQVKGAYSLAILVGDDLYAVRDPHGVRPLVLGSMSSGYVVASETCAFDLIGATFVRDIEPGEIVKITPEGKLESSRFAAPDRAFCIFEYIYFARPDSNLEGRNVYLVRKNLGAELARESPAQADVVIPVPDSGVPAAMGYAEELGVPLEFGLIRNHYVGRTFIEPQQSIRDFGVKVKLNANTALLAGKRVVVVDDSIVRGTTSKKIVSMLRQAGAKEVHMRISSPPTTGPCHYGIDTPSRAELIASRNSVEEIAKYVGADSLSYLSIEGMYRAVGKNATSRHFCDACFSANYRLGEPAQESTKML
ncbi:MAG: amidophosphoribosyltransferase [Deltaproteobacteria bacterium]|nr:amidophosphoribosyltransferase [Deltaproteobacteria bacterium]